MLYTDSLNYYKSGVHKQLPQVQPEKPWAHITPEASGQGPASPPPCPAYTQPPANQKGRPRPRIAAEFTWGTNPMGRGGAPAWDGEAQDWPGGGGGAPSFRPMVWLYRWMLEGLGCPSTGKGL